MTDMKAPSPIDRARAVSPALAAHTEQRIIGDLWQRPGLDARDRSLITVAALLTAGQTSALTHYTGKALDSGVKPAELSELVLHLAYYAGWGKAMAAVVPIGDVFADRSIDAAQLPEAVCGTKLPLDEAAEAKRRQTVGDNFGKVAPGLVDFTTDYLFLDLWLRPELAPRDRSLITVAALVAAGQAQQIMFHLNRAMDNGLTREQAAEVVTHLAFYAGWPNAMTALPVFKDVFASREK